MDKSKISKDILQGVDLCSKHLQLIKSQIIDYLSDNKKKSKMSHFKDNGDDESIKRGRRVGGDGVKRRGESEEETPLFTFKEAKKSKPSGGRREESGGEGESEQDSGEKSNQSDPEFTVSSHRRKRGGVKRVSSKKGRGRPRKGEETPGTKKGRGRPRKTPEYVEEDSSSGAEDEKQREASSNDDGDEVNVSPSKGTSGESHEGEEREDRETGIKKGRGRPSKNLPYLNGTPKAKTVSSRGRGRPSNKPKVVKDYNMESSGVKKARGRPSNKSKIVSNDVEENDKSDEDESSDKPAKYVADLSSKLEDEGQ